MDSRAPLEEVKTSGDVCMSDRLIPSRSTCDLIGQLKIKSDENWKPQNEYQEILSQNVLQKESLRDVKVLSYKNKPQMQEHVKNEHKVLFSCNRDSAFRPKARGERVVPQTAMKILDAPGIIDDFYGHPVDWSAKNVVGVALSETVFLFNASSGSTEKLLSLPSGSVTSFQWTIEGAHASVGTSWGDVQIWDVTTQRQIRNLRGHGGRIGSLAWNEHMLSSGGADAEVHNHDVRVRDHLVGRLAGAHEDLICGLDYSSCGAYLASGGNDNTVCIWDTAQMQSPLRTLTEHRAAVKAVRWCPWQRNVLATGGGSADRQICLWNVASGRLLMSTDAQSQVTGLLWGKEEKELVSSHGFSRNQLSVWKYPALVKSADLEGHSGRILGIAQSPDGSLVCSASADETLRFWKVFSPTSSAKENGRTVLNPMMKTIR